MKNCDSNHATHPSTGNATDPHTDSQPSNPRTKHGGSGWWALTVLAAFLTVSLAAVAQTAPAVAWANPADITYGTMVNDNQFNAAVTVGGTNVFGKTVYFVGSTTSGIMVATNIVDAANTNYGGMFFLTGNSAALLLNAGVQQTLSMTFTPADTATYSAASATVKLTVLPAPLLVTVGGRTMTYGQILPLVTATDTANPITSIYAVDAGGNPSSPGVGKAVNAIPVTFGNTMGGTVIPLAYVDGLTSFPLGGPGGNITNVNSSATPNALPYTNVVTAAGSDVLNIDRIVQGRIAADTNLLGVTVAALIGGVATNVVQPGTPVGTYQFIVQFIDPQNKLGNYQVQINQNFLVIVPAQILVRAVRKNKTYGDPDPAWTPYNGGAITNVGTAYGAGNGLLANSAINYWQSGDFQFVGLVESNSNDTDPGNQDEVQPLRHQREDHRLTPRLDSIP
jgi:hypothetical protein